MEAEAVSRPVSVAAGGGGDVLVQKNNRIQVSNTKKPLFFYVKLVKRYMKQHDEVEVSALGMAITTVVMIAGILKNKGLPLRRVLTSLVGIENKGRMIQKARVEIVLAKTENFDALMTAKDVKASESIANNANEDNKEAESTS